MTMTPERLAELDAVMAKATPNEWVADKNGYGVNFISGGAHHVSKVGTPYRDPIAGGNNHDTLRENDAAAIVALHNAYPDLRAHIEAQAATIARAIAIIEHCDVTEGVCCCGDDMTTHPEPISCGHSPVDQGSYAASQWLEEARAALTGAA